jgi:tagatose 1,6-diphosphate aldolase
MLKISKQKFDRLNRCATEGGVITAAAMDQRGSLQKSIAAGKGIDPKAVTVDMMAEFKESVSKVLTPHASAILLDTQFGMRGAAARAHGTGLLLAYESSGYDNTVPGRLGSLLDGASVSRLIEAGADAIKILLYYTHEEKGEINEIKHAWIERIGAECAANEVPFFLEPVCYDPNGGDGKDLEFAKRKPDAVKHYTKEFSKVQYHVDVLKAEVPINIAYMEGSKANTSGQVAYSRDQAKALFVEAGENTHLPMIYLSAGVDDDVFRETIELAGESGVNFAGVLCGRATWKEGIPVYAKKGQAALEDWLADRGVANIRALNAVLASSAQSWWAKYGGKEQIQVVD